MNFKIKIIEFIEMLRFKIFFESKHKMNFLHNKKKKCFYIVNNLKSRIICSYKIIL